MLHNKQSKKNDVILKFSLFSNAQIMLQKHAHHDIGAHIIIADYNNLKKIFWSIFFPGVIANWCLYLVSRVFQGIYVLIFKELD